MADRLIRIATTLAVLRVAGVAAIISYQHAVRHEAPHNREEVQGLFCRAVAAGR